MDRKLVKSLLKRTKKQRAILKVKHVKKYVRKEITTVSKIILNRTKSLCEKLRAISDLPLELVEEGYQVLINSFYMILSDIHVKAGYYNTKSMNILHISGILRKQLASELAFIKKLRFGMGWPDHKNFILNVSDDWESSSTELSQLVNSKQEIANFLENRIAIPLVADNTVKKAATAERLRLLLKKKGFIVNTLKRLQFYSVKPNKSFKLRTIYKLIYKSSINFSDNTNRYYHSSELESYIGQASIYLSAPWFKNDILGSVSGMALQTKNTFVVDDVLYNTIPTFVNSSVGQLYLYNNTIIVVKKSGAIPVFKLFGKQFTVTSDGDVYIKVTKKWAIDVITTGRKFKVGMIMYMLVKGGYHIETLEDYNDSLKTKLDNAVINPSIVKTFFPLMSDSYINELIAAIDLNGFVNNVTSFLASMCNYSSSLNLHRKRISQESYKTMVVNLDFKITFPEIFLNPHVSQIMRDSISNLYEKNKLLIYSVIMGIKTPKNAPFAPFSIPSLPFPEAVLSNPMYYMTLGGLFKCGDFTTIKRSNLCKDSVKLFDVLLPSVLKIVNVDVVQPLQHSFVDKKLIAPHLFTILSLKITTLTNIKCPKCNVVIPYIPNYGFDKFIALLHITNVNWRFCSSRCRDISIALQKIQENVQLSVYETGLLNM